METLRALKDYWISGHYVHNSHMERYKILGIPKGKILNVIEESHDGDPDDGWFVAQEPMSGFIFRIDKIDANPMSASGNFFEYSDEEKLYTKEEE
jgi:hypothetical protein